MGTMSTTKQPPTDDAAVSRDVRTVVQTAVDAAGRAGTISAAGVNDAVESAGRSLARRVVTVRVLHEVRGQRQVVSHFNKATKGRIVRELLESGATPRSPSRLAEALRDLGWTVEVDAPGRTGTRLDVVVSDL
jgi:hypothetical protein